MDKATLGRSAQFRRVSSRAWERNSTLVEWWSLLRSNSRAYGYLCRVNDDGEEEEAYDLLYLSDWVPDASAETIVQPSTEEALIERKT